MRRVPLVMATLLVALAAVSFWYLQLRDHEAPAVERAPAVNPLRTVADPELAPFIGDLAALRDRGVLRALVTPSRTDFFVQDGEIRGLQAELLYRFVDWLNRDANTEVERIRLKFVPVPFRELIPALEAGRADLAAAFLTPTPERLERIRIATDFRLSANEVLVTHRAVAPPVSLDDLSGRTVVVVEGSSYATHLEALSRSLVAAGEAPINLRAADARLYRDDLLELVHSGAISMTVVDDYAAELWAQVLDGIVVHDHLFVARDSPLGWGVRHDAMELRAEVAAFARKVRRGSLLGNILFQRYFDNVRFVENPLERGDRDRLEALLPLFERYGKRYGVAPLALAAQAYQESRLDQDAVSSVGAVGIMQLLPSTARDPAVGIENFDELEANIHAGARYLAYLRDRYFNKPGMADWDRDAFALAAYNAGPRAIARARQRAERTGLDPDVWYGQTEVAVAGAIGREPVRYVANIQKYHLAYRLARSERRAREEKVRESAITP